MKNIDFVIKKTALDMGLPEDKVKQVISEYWRQIYFKIVTQMDEDKLTLFLRNIGLFTISKWKLTTFIKKRINMIRNVRKSIKYTDELKKEKEENLKKNLKKSLIYRNLVAKKYAKKFKNI